MTKFRACIDIHNNLVKQIVGGTLSSASPSTLKTNHTSLHPPAHFSALYRDAQVTGSHVILLSPDSHPAATEALAAWPGGLQVGGGITADNALEWLDERGAEKVIVTSWLFPRGRVEVDRLEELVRRVGGRGRVVIDLSCRRVGGKWMVAMERWSRVTEVEVCKETLDMLSDYCSEFLIHAADVEGLCRGIDEELVERLGEWVTIPTTYAGGGKEFADLERVERLSGGKVDLTFGSALDLFGGSGVKFEDCVRWNRERS
ncbi:unnamed protein product [Tuber melanosporum]|uniref:1-(5-phosphoribosyl)-5-[(5-phosphoribosylamino)methylideneamino] imidazole-4-carboxamide isomerase n=1 Tax=Tuber melanosporum (strain Mel28) TaxID=656061 RepID=D5GEF5_TUBMM|nr:uncharacterized protein GSTUM_00006458001 [Tuber melanosporum]CAZ82898.1 unnamed protein product [Tuber melanosporum]